MLSEMMRRVRMLLDEDLQESSFLKTSTESLSLDDMIRARLTDAMQEVLLSAPLEQSDGLVLVSGCEDGVLQKEDCLDGSGLVRLPDDFLRLVSFKMDGWRRPVRAMADLSSDLAARQGNRVLRGNPERPVAAYDHDRHGNKALHWYSLPAGTQEKRVELFEYVPVPRIEKDVDEYVMVPSLLIKQIVERTAGLVGVSMQNPAASVLLQQSVNG